MIMDKARENGAQVMEETKAKTLLKSSENKVEGVKVVSKDLGELELRAPIVVDASGRDCLPPTRKSGRYGIRNLTKLLSGLTTKMPREIRTG